MAHPYSEDSLLPDDSGSSGDKLDDILKDSLDDSDNCPPPRTESGSTMIVSPIVSEITRVAQPN